MVLRVVIFYLITMVFSGGLNALQAGTGPDPDLIQLVQFAPALAVGVMFLLFRRTTKVQARFTPVAEVAGRSAVIVGLLWGCWHIGGFEHGLVYMGLFVVMATALSVVLGAMAAIWTIAAIITHFGYRRSPVPAAVRPSALV